LEYSYSNRKLMQVISLARAPAKVCAFALSINT